MTFAQRRTPWYYGWNVVGVCILVQMAAYGLTVSAFSLFLPPWTQEFGVPVSTLALAITIFSAGAAALSYFIGLCASRYPARRLFAVGLVLLALGLLVMSRATAAWQINAGYLLLLPLAMGLNGSVPTQALVSRWFLQRSGLAIGLTGLGLSLGGMLFPPLIVWLLPLIGWRMIWAGMALLVLGVALPIVLLLTRDRPAADDPAIYARHAAGHAAGGEALTLLAILRRRNFQMIMVYFLAIVPITMTVAVDIAPILASYGNAAGTVALFLSIWNGAQICATVGSGWLADRLGLRLLLVLTALACGGGIMLLAVPTTGTGYLAGVALVLGAVGASWTLTAQAIQVEFGPVTFGRAFGLAFALAPIGTVAAPIVAGVQERTGSFAPALMTLGALALAAALAVFLFYRAPHAGPATKPD